MNKLQQQQQNFEGASLKSGQINNHYKEIYNGILAIKKEVLNEQTKPTYHHDSHKGANCKINTSIFLIFYV